MNFVGTGRRLAQNDIGDLARMFKLETAVVLSIIEVEAAGKGFDNRNRPKILPERHRFYAELGAGAQRDRAVRAGLAYKKWRPGNYPRTSDARYEQLAQMAAINQPAALEATSWGLPQILGDNHAAAGFVAALNQVEAFKLGEREQLLAMLSLLDSWGILGKLRGRDFTKSSAWRDFARRYNGSGYERNAYHTKLAAAYRKHRAADGLSLPESDDAVLVNGMKGEAVRNMQADLLAAGFDPKGVDGRFGDDTFAALRAFQSTAGLPIDGKFGPLTSAALENWLADKELVADPEPETWPQQSQGLVALLSLAIRWVIDLVIWAVQKRRST